MYGRILPSTQFAPTREQIGSCQACRRISIILSRQADVRDYLKRQGWLTKSRPESTLIEGINLRLAMTGCPTFGNGAVSSLPGLAAPMFSRQKETMRLLADYLCPADWRIDHFLREYLYDAGLTVPWPKRTLVLDSPGLARQLSLPAGPRQRLHIGHRPVYRLRCRASCIIRSTTVAPRRVSLSTSTEGELRPFRNDRPKSGCSKPSLSRT